MKVSLTPSFDLSDEHAAGSYETPLLVNRHTGEKYGPADILTAYPSWGPITPSSTVLRMVHAKELTADEREFVDRFHSIAPQANGRGATKKRRKRRDIRPGQPGPEGPNMGRSRGKAKDCRPERWF